MAQTTYEVELDIYQGPFDLLLKAIDEGQLDVFHVSLSQIVTSYFKYWHDCQDLLLASDFLLMAAYLLELKSKLLLPAREEILEEQLLGNIEEALVDHLQEYEIFKNLAQTLRQRKEIFENIYGRHEGEKEEREIELVDVSLKDLVVAFKRVYDEAAKRDSVVAIAAEEVTLEQRVEEIKQLVAGNSQGIPFKNIFVRRTRLEIVVTFLAILELAKQCLIRIVQDRRFEAIFIMARKEVVDHGIREETSLGSN